MIATAAKIKSPVKKSSKKLNETLEHKGYVYAVGRRKSAVATVRLVTGGKGRITINKQDLKDYFPFFTYQSKVEMPLIQVGQKDKIDIVANIKGGGIKGQAEAIQLGISRALLKLNPNFKKPLKKLGLLTRDSRIKERKKYGLKKARRAPQWSKR